MKKSKFYPIKGYYIERNRDKCVEYEDNYWDVVTDPDGMIRNRADERKRKLNDLKSELSHFNSLPGGNFLDVGCGLGFTLSGLDAQWNRYGLEFSEYAAKSASKWAEVFIGTVEEANFSDDFFDGILLYDVIEHVERPEDLIVEIRRILKPGGSLVLGTPDFDSACARRYEENYRMLNDQGHISLFSSYTMHKFLFDFGFEIENVDYPYFDTEFFSKEQFNKLFDTKSVSPAFYGNIMTFYASKTKV
jgi:2-polyprenyl-3-methyl-5-hydroxy-6-metoxy-1,4-benzoquinol methylase